jgi:hypothetical protein
VLTDLTFPTPPFRLRNLQSFHCYVQLCGVT